MTGYLEALAKEKVEGGQAEKIDVFGASLTRRGFVGVGGALLAGLGLVRSASAQEEGSMRGVPTSKLSFDAFIEIHADNTILIRTGKSDTGQSTVFTAYRQIVADELYVPFEAITTVISGDTDRTPDGGGTFDLLGHGMPNIRKAAAYVYQAMLGCRLQATQRAEGSTVRQGRHCFRRRQIYLLRRPRQRPATPSNNSCDGRYP